MRSSTAEGHHINMNQQAILQPGHNCWKIARASKVAFLIDGAAYFQALYDSLPLAEQQINILSWDIYSRLHLIPPGSTSKNSRPTALGPLFSHLLRENSGLRINILNWDFALLFVLSREWLPIYKLDLNSHPRLTFCMDSHCPTGASHHQKVVVLDDRLAFSGGLDLTRGRWDTPEHRADDPRRQAIDGLPLPIRPYHDVQMAVSGPAAAALGELARERWRLGTGKTLQAPHFEDNELWPAELKSALEDVDVAISRTRPEHDGLQAINEVRQLFLDSIASAREYIYIENQYFTAPAIRDALKQRLGETDGPEIVLLLPLNVDGWLGHHSMDMIRVEMIRSLRAVDHKGRFSVYYVSNPDSSDHSINLHAKVMIIDDRFLRIGSANLNNRSMGLDTECDLAIEAPQERPRVREAIRHFRNRLLSQHLATPVEAVDTELRKHHTLQQGIEALRKPGRSLQPLEPLLPEPDRRILRDIRLTDPERPVDAEDLISHFVPRQQVKPAGLRIAGWATALLILLAIAAAWRFSPLNQLLDPEILMTLAADWRQSPLAPLMTLGAFVFGGLLMVPVTALIIVTTLVFEPLLGFVYALTGALLSALSGYLLGYLLGRDAIRQLAGRKINQVSRRLARRGLLTMLFVRIVPVAPFTLINLVAGASHLQWRDYLLGTLIGMTPGILGTTLLTDRVKALLQSPGLVTVATLIAAGAVVLAAGYLLSRRLLKIDAGEARRKTTRVRGE